MRTKDRNLQNLNLTWISLIIAFFITLAQLNMSEFLREDRLVHMLLSASLFTLVLFFQSARSRNFIPYFVAILGLGLMKELTDPQFDVIDLMANGLGFFVALGFQFFLKQFTLQRVA